LASHEEISYTALLKGDLDHREVAAVSDCSIKLYKRIILKCAVIVTFTKCYNLYI
jgi:hypothetical protein